MGCGYDISDPDRTDRPTGLHPHNTRTHTSPNHPPLGRYVLYKERNVLLTEEYACKRNRVLLPAPHRKTMVRAYIQEDPSIRRWTHY